MNIAVASGKGGTGKTTISSNLAYYLSNYKNNIVLVDSDVEEPNCHLFIKSDKMSSEDVCTFVPEIDESLCIRCGKCSKICEFNALAVLKVKVMVFPELCHDCGGCKLVCPVNAISYKKRKIGVIESGYVDELSLLYGKMIIGESMSPPVIRSIKSKKDNSYIKIMDCPPGTSCPTVTAIDGSDIVLLVTEPTPFGLNDLKLIVELVKKMELKAGIIINRSSKNDNIIEEYAKIVNIPVISKIPEKMELAVAYSEGKMILKEFPQYSENFKKIADFIESEVS